MIVEGEKPGRSRQERDRAYESDTEVDLMRLSKLTLAGFKSFADKTEIDFSMPVVGIVGPNGCGKSNVVDAIKWVLGEQSAKSLRGDAMLDVIFNGSSTRKPSGMASVTLTFNNPVEQSGRRRLPLDRDTVSVTRQLYRDGTSEYLINNQRARLRDIRELFMDTGVGTDAYSIIEQGKVDILLQSNATDRREIFEEAAGISRFKARRKEAVRKLERTEQNLALCRERIADTERRLRSVKIQASRARSYQEHSTRLRQLQLSYLLADFHRLSGQVDEVSDRIDQAEADRTFAVRELTELEDVLQDAELDRQAVLREQKQLEHDRLQQESRRQQAHQREEFARSTLADVTRQIQRDAARLDEWEERRRQLQADHDAQQEQVRALLEKQQTSERKLREGQDQYRRVQHELNEKRARIDDEKNGIVDLMRQSTRLHNEIHSIKTFEENLKSTRQKLDQRVSHVAEQLEQLLIARDEAKAKLSEVQSLIEAENSELERQKALSGEFDTKLSDLGEQLARLREQRSSIDTRRAMLQEMQDSLEGVSDPVKALLARAASEQVDDDEVERRPIIRGMLAELIEADVSHAGIIEAALGEYQQAVIVDRMSDICSGDWGRDLIDSLAGRVTFVAIDQPMLPDVGGMVMVGGSESQQSVLHEMDMTCVADLVDYPAWLSPLVWRLLGRTYVVPDLESAMMLRTVMPSGYRFVTRAGQLLETDGRIIAGLNQSEPGLGLISRRSELAVLQAELSQCDEAVAACQHEIETLSDKASHCEKLAGELRQSVYEANAVRVELTGRQDHILAQIDSLERERPVLAAEVEQIHRQLSEADQRRGGHETEAARLEQDTSRRREQIVSLEASCESLGAELEQVGETVTGVRIESGKIAEQLAGAQKQVRQIEVTAADIQRQYQIAQDQLASLRGRIEQLEKDQVSAGEDIKDAESRIDELITQYELIDRKLEKIDESVRRYKEAIQSKRSSVEAADRSLHDCQIRQREFEVKAESMRQRAREQLDMDLVGAYQEALAACSDEPVESESPDEPVESDSQDHIESQSAMNQDEAGEEQESLPDSPFDIDWESVESEIAALRERLARLGHVNIDAIQEQNELESRHDDLARQVNDIEEAERSLRSLITKINDDSRKRFESTFEQIREHFAGNSGLFRKLFGGGRADLFLQPDEQGNVDILESGIEIMAKPPGKEPCTISQLSGGEKTMTAVALLMAIFKTRPSPYAVLDEVDAALDESNVERFVQVVKSFLDKSHFIVITHHKLTMQICDLLYGITMQEQGVSKRVSVRFEQVGQGGKISREAIDADESPQAVPEPELVAVGADNSSVAHESDASSGDNGSGNGSGNDKGNGNGNGKIATTSARQRLAAMLDQQ